MTKRQGKKDPLRHSLVLKAGECSIFKGVAKCSIPSSYAIKYCVIIKEEKNSSSIELTSKKLGKINIVFPNKPVDVEAFKINAIGFMFEIGVLTILFDLRSKEIVVTYEGSERRYKTGANVIINIDLRENFFSVVS